MTIADLKAAGDQSGCKDLRSARTPEIAGVAIDVPESITNPPALKVALGDVAANMLTPGAAMSGCMVEQVVVNLYDLGQVLIAI